MMFMVEKEPISDIQLVFIEENDTYDTYICFKDSDTLFKVKITPGTKKTYIDKCTCHGCGHDQLKIGQVVSIKGCVTGSITHPHKRHYYDTRYDISYETHINAEELMFEKQPIIDEEAQMKQRQLKDCIEELIDIIKEK